jgi:hypothetical protein
LWIIESADAVPQRVTGRMRETYDIPAPVPSAKWHARPSRPILPSDGASSRRHRK